MNIIPTIAERLKLKPIEGRNFRKEEIKKDCKLREIFENEAKAFKRGHAYYEFIHERENVSGDKEIIFMNEVNFS